MKDYIEFASTFLAIMFGVHKPNINKRLILKAILTTNVIGLIIILGIVSKSVLIAIIYFVLLTISLHVLVWTKSADDNDDI
jgi:multisubunit Na+/H+ antiporter MnhF subunit